MFDKSAWIEPPRNALQGYDVFNDLSAVVDELHLSGDPFLVTNPPPDRIVDDWICGQFDGITSISLNRTSLKSVECIIDMAREADMNYLIALGGGEPIDVAKVASDRLDYGFISVPTTAGHDGIVSGRSSVPEGDIRHSVAVDPPFAVVADMELLAETPRELTTAGCTDTISNCTAVKDQELTYYPKNVEHSEYAGAPSQTTAEMLVGSIDFVKPGFKEPTWIAMKALISFDVAMPIAGFSRSTPGTEHLFSHQLDRIAPESALHGHQIGAGSVMIEYFHSGARGEWTDIRDALSAADASTTVDGLDIDDETTIETLTIAHEIRDHYTILGNGVSEETVIEAATIMGVI